MTSSSAPELLVERPGADRVLIEGFARMIAGECDADGVLIAVHDRDGEATPFLFANEDSAIPRETMLCAAEAAAGGAGEHSAATVTTAVAERDGGGSITVTTWFRAVTAGAQQRARDAVARLTPLVTACVRAWKQRRHAELRLLGLTAAVNHCDVGILVVDATGAALFANAAAKDLLALGDAVRLSGVRLAAVRLADTLRLQATIDHVAADGGATSVLALARANRRPLMVAISADPAAPGTVIVNLFDPDRNLRALVEPVCKHYRLSPVETRLACLLADGLSLADAAEAMHVREQSARSYLKQVFLKTDTNRQAELVGMLLKSSVRASCARGVSFV